MKSSQEHLAALRALQAKFGTESGDVVIGRMIPEFAALIVDLAEDLDKAQRKVVYLTWALFGVTVALVGIGIVQIVLMIRGH